MTADRRTAIVHAAHQLIARRGYERTSTAQICASAGVSSGTFFHYFPTKAAVLVAVLEVGLAHTRDVFRQIRDTATHDAGAALERWREHVLGEAADPDLAGLVAAVGTMPDNPEVAAVLRADATVVHEGLTDLVHAGQQQGAMRGDLPAERLAVWLAILAHGVLVHAVEDGAVSPDDLRPELADALARLVTER